MRLRMSREAVPADNYKWLSKRRMWKPKVSGQTLSNAFQYFLIHWPLGLISIKRLSSSGQIGDSHQQELY